MIAAMESAVEADPENAALRVHLARLLVEDGQSSRALVFVEPVLAQRPDHLEALDVAAIAAAAIGDTERSAGWRRLHSALTGMVPHPVAHPDQTGSGDPDVNRAEAAAVGADDDIGDFEATEDWDAVLLEVLGDPGDDHRITLADVAGLDEVKRRLEVSFLGPLRNPKVRRMYGKSLRGGLLLWGPPGCGKTFLARAVAGELGARFVSIGLHDVLDMWLGKSEQNLHSVFESARRQTPCVLFLDEVDAIGHKRTNLARSAGRNVVVQLLSELDGIAQDNEGVFVLGATNQPWDVDPALRRPGRFDRTLLVLPPDEAARQAIVGYHLKDRPVAAMDLAEAARATSGFSGADLRLVCEAAAERAMEDSIRSGDVRPIGLTDVLAAVREVRPSTKPWFEVARNFAMFANDSGEYDELAAYMRRNKLV